MSSRCVAGFCSNTRADRVSLFKFPKDAVRRDQWKWQVQRTRNKWTPTASSVLCSAHFEDSCFDRVPLLKESLGLKVLRPKMLLPSAVPTIFHRPRHGSQRETTSTGADGDTQTKPASRRSAVEKRAKVAMINELLGQQAAAAPNHHLASDTDTKPVDRVKPEVSHFIYPTYIVRGMASVGTQSVCQVATKSASTQLSMSTLKAHVRSKATQTGPWKPPLIDTVSQNPKFQLVYMPVKPPAPPRDSRPAGAASVEVPADEGEKMSDEFTHQSGDSSTGSDKTSEKTSDDGELKCVVFERCLGELFQTCPVCDCVCEVQRQKVMTCLSFTQVCTNCHYSRKWQSEPQAQNVSELEKAADHFGSFTLVEEQKDNTAAEDRLPGLYRRSDVLSYKSSTANILTPQHIVDEESVLKLIKTCPVCKKRCRCGTRRRGPYLIIHQSCYFCHYQRKWASQPEAQLLSLSRIPTKKKSYKKKKKPVDNEAD